MDKQELVFITGGGSGIGKQLAIDFLRSGYRVVIVSDKLEQLEQACNELIQIGKDFSYFVCDISNWEQLVEVVKCVLETYGCPDILINNAGFATYRTIEATDIDETLRLFDVNLLGHVRCTKAFLPHMISRHSGTIVNIASIAGKMLIVPNGNYGAAKHGLVAWSEALQVELKRFNIQVNVICPGRVETAFFNHETFLNRPEGKETRLLTTVEAVSRATFDAISKKRFMTFSPWYWGMISWALSAFPVILKPIYNKMQERRIEGLYSRK